MKLKTSEERATQKRLEKKKRNEQVLASIEQSMESGYNVSDAVAIASNRFNLSMQTIWNIKRESREESNES